MTNVAEILSELTEKLKLHGFEEPKRQAEDLLCELLDCSRSRLYEKRELFLDDTQLALVADWTKRRLMGEPLAYISEHIHFYGCELEITPAVLIPRPETEILVDKVAHCLAQQELKGKVLLDLCSGSGCIGIALKKRFPDLSVFLVDCSSEAIDLSIRNAAINGVKVTALCGDFFAPFAGHRAHYMVCNPPYISQSEYGTLDPQVRDFEPALALIGGKTGLEFYQRLARECPAYLYPKSQVWLEIGYQQASALNRLFLPPYWKTIKFENDWAGHSRFFFLENE